jgi:hypothetical protein
MGRLTLNVLLSFTQFEREVTGERIRDKIAASKKKACLCSSSRSTGLLLHGQTLWLVHLSDQAPAAADLRKIAFLLGTSADFRCTSVGWGTSNRSRLLR